MTYKERIAIAVPNPDANEKTIFNDAADGLLKTKDSSGVVETLATTEGIADTEPKVYVALLNQSGTNAPTATVLKNTLGGEVVWTYVGDVGYYRIEAENCALLNISLSKSAISFGAVQSNRNIYADLYDDGDGPLIDIVLKNLAGAATNIMNNQLVKIEVYP